MARSRYPFLDQMDGVLVSGEVKLGKPDPAIFRLFLARFGLAAEATAYIDDNQPNVDAAAALGMTAFRFRDEAGLRRDLHRLGLPIELGRPVAAVESD
jgi:2-haloacid dehalogenase